MVPLFWLSCAVVFYVYIGYPVLLAVWARLRPRPIAASLTDLPAVSIVIAARNEAGRLGARIDNLLQLDYPARLRQIIVVSDGSTDSTLSVLDRYRGVVDVVSVEAGGKAQALNAGVARATHDILVFTDARQVFARDALIELTASFHDPHVGAVSGELLLDAEWTGRATTDRRWNGGHAAPPTLERRSRPDRRRPLESTIAEGVGLYWRYEKAIRRCESAVGSTLGATGAIYAMRREVWRPLPPETILDDVLAPMRAVLRGYRTVFNERARAYDRAASNARAEMNRKVRTLAGNYQILWLEPRLLLPWRNPVWLQYVSHKIGRLIVPYAVVALAVSTVAISGQSIVYATALFGQCAFYLLAVYGAWLERRDRVAASQASPPWRAPSSGRQGAVNA